MGVRKLHRFAPTILMAGALVCSTAFSQTPDGVQRAARDSVRALGLQTELPRRERPEPLRVQLPVQLVWAALICGILLLLYLMRHQLLFWRGRSNDGWDTPDADAGLAGAPGTHDALASADQLGREGRFVEAMHVLLLQSLAEIRQRLGTQFADSLTSREILRGARLSPQGHTSLREIVAAVELTYFGGYPAAFADYTACRRSFENLRQALAGGGRAT